MIVVDACMPRAITAANTMPVSGHFGLSLHTKTAVDDGMFAFYAPLEGEDARGGLRIVDGRARIDWTPDGQLLVARYAVEEGLRGIRVDGTEFEAEDEVNTWEITHFPTGQHEFGSVKFILGHTEIDNGLRDVGVPEMDGGDVRDLTTHHLDNLIARDVNEI